MHFFRRRQGIRVTGSWASGESAAILEGAYRECQFLRCRPRTNVLASSMDTEGDHGTLKYPSPLTLIVVAPGAPFYEDYSHEEEILENYYMCNINNSKQGRSQRGGGAGGSLPPPTRDSCPPTNFYRDNN